MEFRALLINLFNQLSDTDRQALHFFVGTKVSRKDRDDCTPHGSLRLLDSLFDRNIITEQNFDYLINIFEQINCYDAAEQLKEYKLCIIHTSVAEPISSESYQDPFLDGENDRIRSLPNHIPRQSSQLSSISEEPLSDLERPMIQSNTVTSFEETHAFDEHERKQTFSTMKKKFNLFSIILFTITILSVILCFTFFRFFSTQPPTINPLLSSLTVKQDKELFYIMKEGLQYGDTNLLYNQSFNDAKDLELSYIDRCIGVELQWTRISLISIRFIYSNNRSSSLSTAQSKNLSDVLSPRFSSTFILTSNEEINKINLYSTNFTIIGIQFRTTHGRKSSVFGSNDGHFLTESFENYTFSYAKGRQQNPKGIEMLQFIWIKQISTKQKIAAVPREMREICEFTFISKMDFQLVHAKGIESSWYDLKRKFHREGAECNSTASYYEKTNKEDRGPQLFAIVNNNAVFFHDKGVWEKYNSAKDIRCNIKPWSDRNSSYEPILSL